MEFICEHHRSGLSQKGFTFRCMNPSLGIPDYCVEYQSSGMHSYHLIHRTGAKSCVVGRVDYHRLTTPHRITFWAGAQATSAVTAAAAEDGGPGSGGLTVDIEKSQGFVNAKYAMPLPAVTAMVAGGGPQGPAPPQLLGQPYTWKQTKHWNKMGFEVHAPSAPAGQEQAMATFKADWSLSGGVGGTLSVAPIPGFGGPWPADEPRVAAIEQFLVAAAANVEFLRRKHNNNNANSGALAASAAG